METKVKGYPFVTVDDGKGYTKTSDGTVVVPRSTDDCTLRGDLNQQDIISPVKKAMLEAEAAKAIVVMPPRQQVQQVPVTPEYQEVQEEPVRGTRKRTKKAAASVMTPVPSTTEEVTWELPQGLGTLTCAYAEILVGPGCIILRNSGVRTGMIPKETTKENPAVYIITCRGIRYKALYTGRYAKNSAGDTFIVVNTAPL